MIYRTYFLFTRKRVLCKFGQEKFSGMDAKAYVLQEKCIFYKNMCCEGIVFGELVLYQIVEDFKAHF